MVARFKVAHAQQGAPADPTPPLRYGAGSAELGR